MTQPPTGMFLTTQVILKGSFGVVLLLLGISLSARAGAEVQKEQANIDAMLAKRQYASVASYIYNRPDLMKQPRFLRQLSHVLVNYYAITVKFGAFALKDLEEGERLEDVRGAKGTYQMVGGDWEKVLHDALKAHPDSPDVSFAVGEYLSRGNACGCIAPRLFVGADAEEFRYLDKAHKAGIYDYWSLFRMGNYYLIEPHVDAGQAILLYEKSLDLNADHTETHFNLSSAYYLVGNYKAAQPHASKAIMGYSDPGARADAYASRARIQLALGDRERAESDYLEAIQLRRWHERAFTGMLDLYRTGEDFDKYKKTVKDYLALDYGNTYTFNVYVGYLSNDGLISADREVARELSRQVFSRPEETGAVFFNLGRMAELEGDPGRALQHYNKSLAAMKKLNSPPAGAVETLTQLIAQVKEKSSGK